MHKVIQLIAGMGIVLLTGCGGGTATSGMHPGDPGEAGKLAVSFELLPESLLDGGSIVAVGCTTVELEGKLRVELTAQGMVGLKALYGRLHFNPATWQAESLTSAARWGDDALSLAASSTPGTLDVGIVLAHWDQQDGLTGSGVLGEVVLGVVDASLPAGCTQIRRQLASAQFWPFIDSYQQVYSTLLKADHRAGTISWYHNLPGDYDQNGEVGIADLTPLAAHLGYVFGQEGTGPASIESVVNGDHNYEINIADITPIGINFGLTIDSWHVTFEEPYQESVTLFSVPFSTAKGNPATERIWFEAALGEDAIRPLFFVEPVSGGEITGNRQVAVEESLPHPPRLYTPHYGLSWDSDSDSLVWFQRLVGDGDFYGSVNVGDATPIGSFLGSVGPFEPDSLEWHIDYDGNGEIAPEDFGVVYSNMGATLDGYLFYSTADVAQLPANYSWPVLEPVARRSFLTEDESWGELTIASGDYVWLRPYVGDPTDPINTGAPSEIIQIP